MKLGPFERQVLHYGARQGAVSEDLAGHLAYLAEKEKYYSPALFETLRLVYEKTPSAALLQAVCALLIKGNRTDARMCSGIGAGVEQDLRVTRLYEYFMNSLDPEEETEIPRSALIYFAYQSNLDQERLAFLYAYVQKHRAEFPELYQTYRGQMERFLLQQLYRGRISRNLAYLYENMPDEKLLTKDNCRALGQVLFLQQLDCPGGGYPGRRRSFMTGCVGEQVYPVENGRAYVEIYDRDCEILLEDEQHNRYSAGRGIGHQLTRLMNPQLQLKRLAPLYAGSAWLRPVFLRIPGRPDPCYEKKTPPVCARLRAGRSFFPAFARAIRMALIRFYYEQEELEELDLSSEGGAAAADRKRGRL